MTYLCTEAQCEPMAMAASYSDIHPSKSWNKMPRHCHVDANAIVPCIRIAHNDEREGNTSIALVNRLKTQLQSTDRTQSKMKCWFLNPRQMKTKAKK